MNYEREDVVGVVRATLRRNLPEQDKWKFRFDSNLTASNLLILNIKSHFAQQEHYFSPFSYNKTDKSREASDL